MGSAGAAATIGATGATGLQWQGTWNVATAYALNDAVSYNGTSYISIGTGPGHQPDISPASWSVLAGQGAVGATGAPGVAGATGATGAAGSAGAAGATGATGSAGATGATGLQWQGTWNVATAYALNDAVSYNGTSYISIGTGPGHQPDISPTFWSVLAGQGAVGATGAAGVAGATGATGVAGSAGAAGATGATGSAGATGATGLQWQGTWNAATAYALNDAVSYNGTSYISIGTGPGHQPDSSPTFWSVLAGQGAVGATGAPGVAGATGATGVAGSAGAAGATGATGSVGATGATGLQWQGTWNVATAYALNDAVSYNGTSYISIGTGPGHQPDISPTSWSVLAGQGAAGATGAPGVAGATGATGAVGSAGAAGANGATGSVGATGATGLQWQGTWNVATAYALNDAVSYNGTSYISIGTGPGHQPDSSPTFWSVLAGQGAVGATGAPGVAGATGATGVAGSAGAAGATGATGSAGATGATGLQWQGTWNVSDGVCAERCGVVQRDQLHQYRNGPR